MKRGLVFLGFLTFSLTTLGAQGPRAEVSALIGTLRTPNFFLFTELSGKTPGFELLERWWQVGVRSRAFGTAAFFSNQSMDLEIRLETPFDLGGSLLARAFVGWELDYRTTNQIRSAAVTTTAPVLGGGLLWDGDWIRTEGTLATLIYQDGLSLKFNPEVKLRWLRPLSLVLKGEVMEVGSFSRNLWEFRWESYAGLSWEF